MNLDLTTLLKILADPTRLRMLGLLAREELSVTELARAVAMSQPRVSNHLKLLREHRMLEERREGAFVLLRLARGTAVAEDLWTAIEARLSSVEGRADDCVRLEQVLEERRKKSRSFFDRMASEWDGVGSEFRRGEARWQALASLVERRLVVADVGCGTGYVARSLARVVDRVICIDHSAAMLDRARAHLAGHAIGVEFRQGELDRLPLADGEVDAIFANLVLHHVPDVIAALREMRRALVAGGRLVLTDLLPHKEAWMSESMADLRLGLDPIDLKSRVEKSGFLDVVVETVEDAYVVAAPDGRKVELPLFLIRAQVPQNAASDVARGRPSRTQIHPGAPHLAPLPHGENPA